MPAADPRQTARRIFVYGVTGSGKTTAAARISTATGLPWHAVDELTWEPGWVQVPEEEQRRRITAICDEPEWVLDTAYGIWKDLPLARADLVVALDYPRWFSLQRLVRRTLARVVDKQPICNGNTESVRLMVSKDSIIAWHFRSFASKRERIRTWSEAPSGPPVLRFSSPAALEQWMATLRPVERSSRRSSEPVDGAR